MVDGGEAEEPLSLTFLFQMVLALEAWAPGFPSPLNSGMPHSHVRSNSLLSFAGSEVGWLEEFTFGKTERGT